MTILGLGVCMNHTHFKDLFSEIFKHKTLSLSGILLPLVLGSLIVTLHNIWVDGWTLLITLTGYFFLLIATMRTIMPEFWMSFFKNLKINIPPALYGLITLVIGLVLMYHGFLI